ncbi:MAG: Cobalt-zinc-cadmium resistance protein CzcC [Verrucomicrobiae bacterium]|nr:Cobalt-zinc-cadmium resistance protein CzcC [Verrucomicrobiae bacterium]
MKILNLYLLGGVLLYLSPSVARADALTAEQAVQTALAQNPELLAARQQIEAATGRAVQARLWPNPELELSSEEFPPRGGGFSSAQNLVGVAQTVPFPGKKPLDARIGRQAVTVAEWEYLGREIELVREVKTAFTTALAAEKKVTVSAQLLELARSLADAAAKRVAAGAATDQERLRAEIELDRATVELTAARRELVEAQTTLATLMGRAREPVGPLHGELRETADLPALEQAREQMLARHPNIRAAAAGKERAELELRRAKIEPLPDVTVGVAGGRDFGEKETIMEFRVSLPLPIFDRAQGRKREARAEAEIARFDLTATEQRLIRELSVVDARLRAVAEQVEAYRKRILPKAEEALQLVRGGFEAGKFGFLDLVDTQRTLAESRLAYYEKLSELNAAQAELEALVLKDQHAPPAGQPQPKP